MTSRRFPPPWQVEQIPGGSVVGAFVLGHLRREEWGNAVMAVAGAILFVGFIIPYCVTEWLKDRRARREAK